MECRVGCGACCVGISISSAIPGMPKGKPAGVRCVQLDDDGRCRLFGRPERPTICGAFEADPELCGANRDEAMERIARWEEMTGEAVG